MVRSLMSAAMLAFVCGLAAGGASAQASLKPAKVGVLTDITSNGSNLSGQGSVIAAQMAVEDYKQATGREVELLVGDEQSKPDIASTIARQWYDSGVEAIVDLPPSSVALAVQAVAKERGRIALFSTAGALDLVGKQCSETGFQWAYNAVAVSRALVSAVVQTGGKSWFLLVNDSAYGRSIEEQTKRLVEANGASVLGAAHVPVEMTDFSANLIQGQTSGAQVVAIGVTGQQGVTSVKQAHEFGLGDSGRIVGLSLLLTEIRGIGLELAQNLLVADSFYWDMNDATRAWSARFAARYGGRMPTSTQAGVYSALTHFLKARDAAGSADAKVVAAKMRAMPVEDFMTKRATIQPNGWVEREFYLFQAKKPAESRGEWDLLKLVRAIPAKDVAPTDTGCPLR